MLPADTMAYVIRHVWNDELAAAHSRLRFQKVGCVNAGHIDQQTVFKCTADIRNRHTGFRECVVLLITKDGYLLSDPRHQPC